MTECLFSECFGIRKTEVTNFFSLNAFMDLAQIVLGKAFNYTVRKLFLSLNTTILVLCYIDATCKPNICSKL